MESGAGATVACMMKGAMSTTPVLFRDVWNHALVAKKEATCAPDAHDRRVIVLSVNAVPMSAKT